MKFPTPVFKPLLLAVSVSLAACGGGGSDDDTTDTASATSLSGTAAAGAALVGRVTVKGAQGNTVSTLIEADGSYDVDVSSLTAPYRLRAEGNVGGRSYVLHSYAEAADVGGVVNVTPFTDLIVANAAQQLAANFFESNTDTSLDPAELDAQEQALQEKLKNVFDQLGVQASIDLLNTAFSADHSGLDAALDVLRVEVDPATQVAVIQNVIDNTQITDNLADPDDNTETLTATTAVQTAVTSTQAILQGFQDIESAFASGLPTASAVENYFSPDFLHNDANRSLFLTEITSNPRLVGLKFSNMVVSNVDDTLGTAEVRFHLSIGDYPSLDEELFYMQRGAANNWMILGNQQIAEIQFTFNCNDIDPNDSYPAACGVIARVEDMDFTNNGTSSAAIASATVEILDATGSTVKGTIYLGTGATAGELQVWNEGQGQYTYDWKGFGTGVGDISPSIFEAGDIVRFKLYTEALDVTVASNPQIASGATPVATYEQVLAFAPSSELKLPALDSTSITAIQNYSVGSNLSLNWVLAEGTRSDTVLIHVDDGAGNETEVVEELENDNVTSVTVSSSSLDVSNLDPNAAVYHLLVRVSTRDAVTGQEYSVDYTADIAGPGAGGNTGGTTLTCGYESGWDDTLFGGNGGPINPNSFADYEAVIADCGTAMAFATADIAGNTYVNGTESTVFNDDAGKSGTSFATAKTGTYSDSADGTVINITWWVEAATCTGCNYNYLVIYTDDSIDSNLPNGMWFRETAALTGISGLDYSFVKYSESADYSDTDRATGSDGEIWYDTQTRQ